MGVCPMLVRSCPMLARPMLARAVCGRVGDDGTGISISLVFRGATSGERGVEASAFLALVPRLRCRFVEPLAPTALLIAERARNCRVSPA